MNDPIVAYSIENLLDVCLNRKMIMYSLLENCQNIELQKYYIQVIYENHLCFQNIHFTIADTHVGITYIKGVHAIPLNGKRKTLYHLYHTSYTLNDCLENEKKSMQIFKNALQYSMPSLVHLIVEHEIKCLHKSVLFLEKAAK